MLCRPRCVVKSDVERQHVSSFVSPCVSPRHAQRCARFSARAPHDHSRAHAHVAHVCVLSKEIPSSAWLRSAALRPVVRPPQHVRSSSSSFRGGWPVLPRPLAERLWWGRRATTRLWTCLQRRRGVHLRLLQGPKRPCGAESSSSRRLHQHALTMHAGTCQPCAFLSRRARQRLLARGTCMPEWRRRMACGARTKHPIQTGAHLARAARVGKVPVRGERGGGARAALRPRLPPPARQGGQPQPRQLVVRRPRLASGWRLLVESWCAPRDRRG